MSLRRRLREWWYAPCPEACAECGRYLMGSRHMHSYWPWRTSKRERRRIAERARRWADDPHDV